MDADPNAPPSVALVVPANNATGVSPTAKIVITFTKPMDHTTTELAWTSADLPAANVTFAWNATSDTLTVTPKAQLPIAEGVGLDPSVVQARQVSFTVAGSAQDTQAKTLGTPLTVTFSTIRRMTTSATLIDALTQSVQNDGTIISPASGGVGDSGATNVYFRVFASFTLPALPSGAVVQSAVLSGVQQQPGGTPYAKLGNLLAQHVNFAAFNVNTFAATPLSSAGTFSTTPTLETKSLGVTTQVMSDYTNATIRGNRSQFRLEFPTGTNNDGVTDIAFFTRTQFNLSITYDAN